MRTYHVPFALLLLSCTPSKRGSDALDPNKLPPNSPSDAFSYVREDPSCSSNNALTSIAEPAIRVFEHASVTSIKATLRGAFGNPYLAGPHISLTAYDYETRKDCSPRGDCQERIIRGASALPICRADGAYARESVEGVGVTSYAHLDRVFQAHADASGKTLSQVRLFILPKVVEVDANATESIMSDNAAYVGGEKAVLMYPKGRIGAKLWPNVNLWESSFVVAHEGAHHIFQEYFFNTIRPNGALASLVHKHPPVLKKLKESDYFPSPTQREAQDSHGVDANEVIGAVNEGFADLYAYYAVRENSASIGEMACFTKGRDVASPFFRTGEKKELSANGLNTFLSPVAIDPYVPSQTYPCDVLDFQDIHHLGAIIVHGLDRVFADSARVKSASDKTKEKAKLATEWVDAMAKRTLAEASRSSQLPYPGVFLQMMVEEGVRRGSVDGKTLTATQCAAVKDVFPVYEADWKRTGVFTCQ